MRILLLSIVSQATLVCGVFMPKTEFKEYRGPPGSFTASGQKLMLKGPRPRPGIDLNPAPTDPRNCDEILGMDFLYYRLYATVAYARKTATEFTYLTSE